MKFLKIPEIEIVNRSYSMKSALKSYSIVNMIGLPNRMENQ